MVIRSHDGTRASDAWREFLRRLESAGAVLDRESTPRDDLTQAEGLRKLVRLVRIGFEATLEYADVTHPTVYPSVTPTTLGEGETSDARYHQAFLDGSRTYRLTGRRGDAPLVEFTTYTGKIGLDEHSRRIGFLTERELAVEPDGTYEIVLGPDPHPKNWLRTTSDTKLLYIRQYAHDWPNTRGATFEMRQEGVTGPPAPLRRADVERALDRTAAYVERAAHAWAAIVDGQARREPNRFYVFPEQDEADSPEMPAGHRFASGYFRLAPGEALVVELRPADVPYWGVDVTNYWFEPLSYGEHRSHVNNRTARFEPDGRVRIAIGPNQVSTPNWIDTAGHTQGVMLFRWSRTREPIPELSMRIATVGELRSVGRPDSRGGIR